MTKQIVAALSAGVVLMSGTAAVAQGTPTAQQVQSRYQIAVMEQVLATAVEHGAEMWRDRLQAIVPADLLLSENARARGFRLDGYGVFFDVEVPSLEGTLAWSFRTLDQNGLGLANAWNAIRSHIEADAAADPNLQQALKRLELQVAPMATATSILTPTPDSQRAVAGPATVTAASGGAPAVGLSRNGAAPAVQADPILIDPQEAYRAEVRDALMDAMLEHSRGLGVGANEWLTIAARRNDDRPRLAPVDTSARTVLIRVRGSDLAAFLGGQISHEDARTRMEVRVF